MGSTRTVLVLMPLRHLRLHEVWPAGLREIALRQGRSKLRLYQESR